MNEKSQATRPPKIHTLTSARFFAALYVLFYHTGWGVPAGGILDRFRLSGFVAVEFFFFLSGYILAVVYLDNGRPIVKRSFYLARFARVYPLYIIAVLADTPFAVAARTSQYGLKGAIERVALLVAPSFIMMQMWVPILKIVNIPSWSLSVEAVFYLFFPILGPTLYRLSKRAVVGTALVFYVGSLALNWRLNIIYPNHLYGFDILSYTSVFSLGILLARWRALTINRLTSQSSSGILPWFVLGTCLASFCGLVYISPSIQKTYLHLGFLLSPMFAGCVWALASPKLSRNSFLNAPLLIILGEASYGLYLIHVPILHLFEHYHLNGRAWDYPLYLTSCIGLSILSFYFLETPARRWINMHLRVKSRESIEVSADAQ